MNSNQFRKPTGYRDAHNQWLAFLKTNLFRRLLIQALTMPTAKATALSQAHQQSQRNHTQPSTHLLNGIRIFTKFLINFYSTDHIWQEIRMISWRCPRLDHRRALCLRRQLLLLPLPLSNCSRPRWTPPWMVKESTFWSKRIVRKLSTKSIWRQAEVSRVGNYQPAMSPCK